MDNYNNNLYTGHNKLIFITLQRFFVRFKEYDYTQNSLNFYLFLINVTL